MQPEANDLWDRYLQGDKAAFERIYFTHVNRLYDYGMRMTQDTALVEDCIQDLFADLWEKRAQMKPVHTLMSYLLVAVKRRIIRKLSIEQKHTVHPSDDWYHQVQDFTPQVFEGMDEGKSTHLTQAFTKLSDRQKEVIYLRFYNQLSYEEIAEVMSVQVKAIYKLTARAIQVLRTHMGTPMFTYLLFVILAT